jgi:hypothetical protein
MHAAELQKAQAPADIAFYKAKQRKQLHILRDVPAIRVEHRPYVIG